MASYKDTGRLDFKKISKMLIAPKDIIKNIDESVIAKLQNDCQKLYEDDSSSCDKWRRDSKKLMEMATMSLQERGHIQPWQSDIQMPDLINSAIQFNARTYPEYVKDGKICQSKIVGKVDDDKQKRADRVCAHINWQLTEEIEEWPENMDKLLMVLPIVGCVFRVTQWDDNAGRIIDTLAMPDRVTIDNNPNNPDWARRISIDVTVTQNECIAKKMAGVWRDVEMQASETAQGEKIYNIVHMHTLADLDDDEYEEPYILTFCKDDWKLLAITPRFDKDSLVISYDPNNPDDSYLVGINPVRYVTRYVFFFSPDGSALGMGYGHIMKGMVQTRNTCINQLMDAGTRQNLGGGFIKQGVFRDDGLRVIRPGMFEVVDGQFSNGSMSDAIFPFPAPQAAPTTMEVFSVLGDSISRIAATGDIMSGEGAPANMPAASVLAIIEQGKTGQKAILKRINQALSHELAIIYRLNKAYLTDQKYFSVGDFDEKVVARKDYDTSDFDIVPVADPMYSTRIERLMRIQAAMQAGIVSPEIKEMYLVELGFDTEEAKKLAQGDQAMQLQAQQAQQQMELMKQHEKTADAEKRALETQLRLMQVQNQAMVERSAAILNMAKARQLETDTDMIQQNAELEQMAGVTAAHPTNEEIANEQEQQQQPGNQPGGVSSLVGQPGDAGSNGVIGSGLDQTGSGEQPEPGDTGGTALPAGAGGYTPASDEQGSLGEGGMQE